MTNLNSISETASLVKNDGSVAIIMRTKNRPITLARALKSVIEQNYQHWHLYLIVSDNRYYVDRLIELNQFYLQNKITTLYSKESLDPAASANYGFSIANEEFLILHDDDDSWHPDFLKETVSYLQLDKDAVAVATNCLVINEQIQNETIKILEVTDWWFCKNYIYLNDLIRSNILPSISLLIRMKKAKEIGLFNEAFPIFSDWDYSIRLSKIGEIKKITPKLAFWHKRLDDNYNNYSNLINYEYNKYIIKYLNSLTRSAVTDHTNDYGLLHAVLVDNDQKYCDVVNKLNNLEEKLIELQSSASYLKRKSFPLRRTVAKFRNRFKLLRNRRFKTNK